MSVRLDEWQVGCPCKSCAQNVGLNFEVIALAQVTNFHLALINDFPEWIFQHINLLNIHKSPKNRDVRYHIVRLDQLYPFYMYLIIK